MVIISADPLSFHPFNLLTSKLLTHVHAKLQKLLKLTNCDSWKVTTLDMTLQYGFVEIHFQHMKERPVIDNVEKSTELLKILNTIPGVLFHPKMDLPNQISYCQI